MYLKVLELYFFNVGHGDSIAIRFPKDKWGVIDCNYDASITQPQVLTFLQNKNVENLEFLCITHPHEDHYSGCEKIVDKINIENLFLSGMFHEQEEFLNDSLGYAINAFCDKYNYRKLYKRKIDFPLRTKSIKISGVKIEFLNPKAGISDFLRLDKLRKNDLAYNNVSIVFLLKYKNIKILLNSDSTKECWNEILEQYTDDLSSDIIKISHHGSRTDNTDDIMNNIIKNKAVAIISTDGGKRYKSLPSQEVIKFLRENLNSKVLLTSSLNNTETSTNVSSDKLIEAGLDFSFDKVHQTPEYDGYLQIIIDDEGKISENIRHHI